MQGDQTVWNVLEIVQGSQAVELPCHNQHHIVFSPCGTYPKYYREASSLNYLYMTDITLDSVRVEHNRNSTGKPVRVERTLNTTGKPAR